MSAKTNRAASTTVSPIVAAMLAGSNRRPLTDRIVDATADTLNTGTEVVGRLWEAVDTDRFSDGQKVQKLRNLAARQQRWADLQRELGLSDEDVAAIIAN